MFTTVYDISEASLFSTFISVLLSMGTIFYLVIILILGGVVASIKMRDRAPFLRIMPVFIPILVFGVPIWISMARGRATLIGLYQDGRCAPVEGIVHVETRQEAAPNSADRITISGVPLLINHFEFGAHYRDSLAYGGVLDEGVEARVWHCPPGSLFQGSSTGPIVRVDLKK